MATVVRNPVHRPGAPAYRDCRYCGQRFTNLGLPRHWNRCAKKKEFDMTEKKTEGFYIPPEWLAGREAEEPYGLHDMPKPEDVLEVMKNDAKVLAAASEILLLNPEVVARLMERRDPRFQNRRTSAILLEAVVKLLTDFSKEMEEAIAVAEQGLQAVKKTQDENGSEAYTSR